MLSVARTPALSTPGLLLPAKPADLVQVGGFAAFAFLCLGSRTSGGEAAAALFAGLAVAPLILRAIGVHLHSRSLQLLADFFPILAIVQSYEHLNPVSDFFHLPLADARLQQIDQALFGRQLSVALSPHLTGSVADALMLCYVSYYLWPFLLGALLYWRQGEAAFDRWSLVVITAVLLNYACYFAVPAVGPRFAQQAQFGGPLLGAFAGPMAEAFARSPYRRDCFPSGHTALTLLVLFHAWRTLRPFFWAVLPVGIGLICATVALRFHYGVDLLAAVPFAAVVYALSERFFRGMPGGLSLMVRPDPA